MKGIAGGMESVRSLRGVQVESLRFQERPTQSMKYCCCSGKKPAIAVDWVNSCVKKCGRVFLHCCFEENGMSIVHGNTTGSYSRSGFHARSFNVRASW